MVKHEGFNRDHLVICVYPLSHPYTQSPELDDSNIYRHKFNVKSILINQVVSGRCVVRSGFVSPVNSMSSCYMTLTLEL